MKKLALVLVGIMVMAFTGAADAQAKGRGGPGGPGGEGFWGGCGEDEGCRMEKMKEMRGKMLRERIGLTEEKAKKVEAVLDGFHERHMAMREKHRTAMRALKDLVKADSNDQEAYKNALDEMKANHQERQALMEEQMEALKKVVDPKEQAKLFLAHERMTKKMHKFMKEGKKGKKGKKGKRGDGEGMGPMGR